jgi:hypothetical protein
VPPDYRPATEWPHHLDQVTPGQGMVGHATVVRQLIFYRFGSGAEFQGRLVGALERLESGGALRILDVLFVRRSPESGDIEAIDAHGGGGLVAPLLDFRLDEAARRRATERAVRAHADLVHELGDALEPGSAVAAVLVDHVWSGALTDAAERTGGTLLANDFVDADELRELRAELLAAAGRSGGYGLSEKGG